MKNLKLKLVVATISFLILLSCMTSIFAANEEIQILKKSDKEYMIYLEGNLSNAFEFTFSNEKDADKELLIYKNSATDSAEENSNYIAYVDEEIISSYNFSKPTYLWARTMDGTYIAEAVLINLTDVVLEEDVELANTITKRIDVDTTQTFDKPAEMIDGVKQTKTVGKVEVKEKGNTYYQLVKVPESGDCYNFMKIAEKIANNKVEDNFYAKLEVAKEFSSLYEKLLPAVDDTNWALVKDNQILQPEEAKQDEQYILWLKNESDNKTTLDAQFLTCFEDYKPEVISEKIVTKLPVTADDPTLFIILGALVVALVIVIAIRSKAGKTKKASKH